MKSYVEKFKTMVDEIRSHPLLNVIEFNLNPPATEEMFDAEEQKLGAKLAKPIRSFYGEANGLKLHWQIKQPPSEEKADEIAEKYDDYDIEFPEDEDIPFAQIHLLPLVEAIIHKSWPQFKATGDEKDVEFAGKTYSYRDFVRHLKPFDVFSTYYCMAFFLEKGVGNPKVLMLGDYYIEWDNSRITDFASYMELLFVTTGIVESRNTIYNEYRGNLKPLLITDPDYWKKKHIPKLFRKKK